MGPDQETKVIRHPVPEIKLYEVYESELQEIKDAASQAGSGLAVSGASSAAFISCLIEFSAADPASFAHTISIIGMSVSGVLILVGIPRWWRTRKRIPKIVQRIRSRKPEPSP